MSLFETNKICPIAPLAEAMRPQILDSFLGQTKIIGASSWLKRVFLSKTKPSSMVFWGPPGSGKTSLARLLSQYLNDTFWMSLNAVDLSSKQLKEIGTEGRRKRIEFSQMTCVFVDEIHRLNRTQQDVLLPYMERNDLILIGATTENPSFQLSPALLSRLRLFVFEALEKKDLELLAKKALQTYQLASQDVFEKEAFEKFICLCKGDARQLLNHIEFLVNQRHFDSHKIDLKTLEKTWFSPNYYGGIKEEHYNCISAFIKSMRGSDPDAAVYYLARMLEGGEDPLFIARRLIIFASEDIGNSDPRALSIATSGIKAVESVGLPECGINLAQVTTYLACAPKSNRSYKAFLEAKKIVKDLGPLPIPQALSSSSLVKNLNTKESYKYSHDSEKGYISQNFLPEKLKGLKLYKPSLRGFEKIISEYLKWMKS